MPWSKEALSSLVKAAEAEDTALANTGASLQTVTAAHDQHVAELKKEAAQLGLTGPEVNKLIEAYAKIPPSVNTKATFDSAAATSQIGQLQAKIQSVPQNWFTKFAGDILGLSAAVGQASAGIGTVPGNHPTAFTGDINALTAATLQAKGDITSVEASYLTQFLGDPAGVNAATAAAKAAIASTPGNHDTILNAIDRASQVAALVKAAYAQIPTSVITTITTIQRIVQGAEGMILSPMAAGGIVPMAPGGRLSPMSGNTARIVPANTWRVIGDRMHGDEAFIPINNSAWSTALLGQTANRMGYALAPMAHGGISWRDHRAWDWLEQILCRYRHGHGGGRPGPAMMDKPLIGSGVHNITNMAAFSGGMASISRLARGAYDVAATRMVPVPAVPTGPSMGGGRGRGGEPVVLQIKGDGSRYGEFLAGELRKYVRVQAGGDVQRAFGQ